MRQTLSPCSDLLERVGEGVVAVMEVYFAGCFRTILIEVSRDFPWSGPRWKSCLNRGGVDGNLPETMGFQNLHSLLVAAKMDRHPSPLVPIFWFWVLWCPKSSIIVTL